MIIDPLFEQARHDTALLRELGLRAAATLDTHVHADHVTGAWLLKQRSGSRIMVSAAAGAAQADRLLVHRDSVAFGSRHLEVRSAPGHTDGFLTYVLDEQRTAFTGDSLLIRGCGRTDFQHGSTARLVRSVRDQILLPRSICLLYPAHDYRGITVTSVAEERRFNPRLGGDANATDFAGYMDNLGLPHPRPMDIAVPANPRCGDPAAAGPLPDEPDWAPLTCIFGGLWEIEPEALLDCASRVQVVGVRESAEFDDVLGHLRAARQMPLSVLAARSVELDRGRPVVAVCRLGAHLAQATRAAAHGRLRGGGQPGRRHGAALAHRGAAGGARRRLTRQVAAAPMRAGPTHLDYLPSPIAVIDPRVVFPR